LEKKKFALNRGIHRYNYPAFDPYRGPATADVDLVLCPHVLQGLKNINRLQDI
jgi:hypothetical protein